MKKFTMKKIKISAPQPFFSIIITTYNRAHLIKRAINSLVSQTEEDWEAIIIDDESTDNTHDQILQYISNNPKIRYIRKTHGGEVESKNKGIYSSNGKFVSFLDSDDEYDPDHLKSRKRILLKNPEVKFLYGGVKIIGDQYVPDRFDYSKKIHLKDCVIGGTFFVERHCLISLNGFSEALIGTDAVLFERAEKDKIEMMKVNIPSYIYHREYQDSITHSVLMSL